MRGSRLWNAAAVLIGLGLAACSRTPGPDAVATVDGEAISRKDFDARLTSRLESLREEGRRDPTADERTRLRRAVLDELIARQLMVQAARRQGEAVSAQEVDAAIAALRDEFIRTRKATGGGKVGAVTTPSQQTAGAGDALLEALRERGITLSELRADVEANLLARRFAAGLAADVTADEAEARRYYDAHTPKFNRPARYRLRLIAAANQGEARAIVMDLRRGKTTFAQEAERRAAGILERVRGEMGWVELATLPPELAGVVAGLRPGDIGGPVVGKDSVYLVQLVEKREAVETPFEKIKADLVHVVRQEKRAARVREWVARERAAARIVLAEDWR